MRKVLIAVIGATALVGCTRSADHKRADEQGHGQTQVQAAEGRGPIMPSRKPGLWQMAMNTSTGPGLSFRMQVCVDPSTAGDFDIKPPSLGKKADCDKRSFRPEAGGWAFESVCRVDGRTLTTQGRITGFGSDTYHLESTTRTDPPAAGIKEANSTIDAKWLGPCPAGMTPGKPKVMGFNVGG